MNRRLADFARAALVAVPLAVAAFGAGGCHNGGDDDDMPKPPKAKGGGSQGPGAAMAPPAQLTPLMKAARQGDASGVKSLLSSGTSVNETDPSGTTALMYTGNPEVANLLISKGAKLDIKDKNGDTALIHLAGGNDLTLGHSGGDPAAVLKVLLSHHADPNAASNDGTTALLAAIANHNHVNGPSDLAASAAAREAKCNALLAAGANPKVKTSTETFDHLRAGETALMAAAFDGDPGLVKIFLAKGIDVNEKDAGGDTALMYAARAGKFDAVKALVDAHADVNVRNSDGDTALKLATRMKGGSLAKCADILTRAGAK